MASCLLRLMALAALPAGLAAQRGGSEWPQWGGPDRSFRIAERNLAQEWPARGPRVLWSVRRASGHGGIAIAEGAVFTMVREGDRDVCLALELADGSVVWERAFEAKPAEKLDYGTGPFAAPLVHEDRVVFLGGTGWLRALDRRTGAPLWAVDLEAKFDQPRADRGYSPSPILVAGNIVVPVGAKGAGVVAFDPQDGAVRWQRHDFGADYATPTLLQGTTPPQLVCHMEEEVIGVAPNTGRLLWQRPSRSRSTQHTVAPLDLGDGRVLVVTTYSTECLRGGAKDVELLWTTRRIRGQVGNTLHLPGKKMILGPSSASSGALLVALDDQSGEMLWRDRGIDCGFLWAVGSDRILGLAADGELVLARADREGMNVLARCLPLSGEEIWSAPAMSGTTLVLKDQERIVALDLGASPR